MTTDIDTQHAELIEFPTASLQGDVFFKLLAVLYAIPLIVVAMGTMILSLFSSVDGLFVQLAVLFAVCSVFVLPKLARVGARGIENSAIDLHRKVVEVAARSHQDVCSVSVFMEQPDELPESSRSMPAKYYEECVIRGVDGPLSLGMLFGCVIFAIASYYISATGSTWATALFAILLCLLAGMPSLGSRLLRWVARSPIGTSLSYIHSSPRGCKSAGAFRTGIHRDWSNTALIDLGSDQYIRRFGLATAVVRSSQGGAAVSGEVIHVKEGDAKHLVGNYLASETKPALLVAVPSEQEAVVRPFGV